MFANVIANRYAQAVMQSCPDLATIEKVEDELTILGKTFVKFPEIKSFLINPKMPSEIKKQIIRNALSPTHSPIVVRLLELLIEKRRQNLLPDIADRYAELTDQARGVEHARIIVATPISPDLEQKLKDAVQRFSARNVETSIKIDRSILGGVQIKLGDKVIDGSLKKRFNDIRRAMLAARLPKLAASPDNDLNLL
ncbi:MAG: ATP synthase F1 subunit delta [bacterium]|nr:ATP synthase F1 subunit delta [bacterium]